MIRFISRLACFLSGGCHPILKCRGKTAQMECLNCGTKFGSGLTTR